jgi:hypothetical protein
MFSIRDRKIYLMRIEYEIAHEFDVILFTGSGAQSFKPVEINASRLSEPGLRLHEQTPTFGNHPGWKF